MDIRDARQEDVERLLAVGGDAQTGTSRAAIAAAVAQGHCLVASEGDLLIGYGFLAYPFLDGGTVARIFVDQGHRRRGVATQLMQSLERRCTAQQLYVPVSIANTAMRALLRRLGYDSNGLLYNADSDEPKQVFRKDLRP
jgi:GNAT superfamily N-acetyltransferase